MLSAFYKMGAIRAFHVFKKIAEMDEDAARELGTKIGIDWKTAKFTVSSFRHGYAIELEHGSKDPETDVTHNDPTITGKIAWAHLKEDPEYYTKLKTIEED